MNTKNSERTEPDAVDELHNVILLLGSNMGDRLMFLGHARRMIAERIGSIAIESSIFQTDAWQMEDSAPFLNQALKVESTLGPNEVLLEILEIELLLGRIRSGVVEDRTIDIDIIFYDDLHSETETLVIPHPRLHIRNFALVPIAEIAPDWFHPVFGKSVSALVAESVDQAEVSIFES